MQNTYKGTEKDVNAEARSFQCLTHLAANHGGCDASVAAVCARREGGRRGLAPCTSTAIIGRGANLL